MLVSFFVLALLGFCISLYSYFLEKKIKEAPSYKAACDINDQVSCTKAMSSPYASLFFVSNSLIGMLFYASIAVLAAIDALNLIFYAALAASLVSLVFAYLLYFKIKTLCILCTSIYLINFIMLFLSYKA